MKLFLFNELKICHFFILHSIKLTNDSAKMKDVAMLTAKMYSKHVNWSPMLNRAQLYREIKFLSDDMRWVVRRGLNPLILEINPTYAKEVRSFMNFFYENVDEIIEEKKK